MTIARHQVVTEGKIGVYHTQSRCVRRAFLCGVDALTGQDYGYRREWVESRLAFVSGVFCVDVLAFSVLSNHWHGVLRTRPDQAAELPDEEVARRWVRLFPGTRDLSPALLQEAMEREVKALLGRKRKLAKVRDRLSSLSWMMKAVNEHIARRSNREDGATGHFWEGRFRCQALLDEAAILACMVYVDLNPVRAKLAEGLGDSRFTSAYDRIRAREEREKQEALAAMDGQIHPLHADRIEADLKPELDRWLLSFHAPDFPIPAITEKAYLELLDATGRCLRAGKRGAIDESVAPILEAVDINVARWVEGVERYGSRTYRVVGHVEAICRAAAGSTVKFFKGHQFCGELFGDAAPAPG